MDAVPALNFRQFVEKFPEVELPVTLTDDSASTFSQRNQPLNAAMVARFLTPLEGEGDEYTEFVPCFRLPATKDFIGIVFWKAGLLLYEYILATFSPAGKPVDRKVLAGTTVVDDKVIKSVATIDPDWIIYVVTGQSDGNDTIYDAASSRISTMELLGNGMIVMPS